MSSYAMYLPSMEDGYLPVFVMLVGVTAITNALSCYRDISNLQRIYCGTRINPAPTEGDVSIKTTQTTTTIIENTKATSDRRASVTSKTSAGCMSPTTELSGRTFATWNFAVGIARLYAAYNMYDKAWYQMSMWTNVVGLLHFGMEILVYKTCRPFGPVLAPVMVATVGLLWHVLQYNDYVK